MSFWQNPFVFFCKKRIFPTECLNSGFACQSLFWKFLVANSPQILDLVSAWQNEFFKVTVSLEAGNGKKIIFSNFRIAQLCFVPEKQKKMKSLNKIFVNFMDCTHYKENLQKSTSEGSIFALALNFSSRKWKKTRQKTLNMGRKKAHKKQYKKTALILSWKNHRKYIKLVLYFSPRNKKNNKTSNMLFRAEFWPKYSFSPGIL